MAEQHDNQSDTEPRWRWYIITAILLPLLIPAVGLYLRKHGWSSLKIQHIAAAFMLYWLIALIVGGLVIRRRFKIRIAQLGSPLIELLLTQEAQARLADFATKQRQPLAVVAFDLLERELPRSARDRESDDLERVRSENEKLSQLYESSSAEGEKSSLAIAVTTGILRRLLIINGADEENRHLWRKFASDTASHIVSHALEHTDLSDFQTSAKLQTN
jgi:hypothetical protein